MIYRLGSQIIGLAWISFLLSGCAIQKPQAGPAQGPVGWGEVVNGLQVGIAAEVTQSPPGQPQAGGDFRGVAVYLKNSGSTSLTIVDPKTLGVAGNSKGVLWAIYTEPDHTAQVDSPRLDPARLLTLLPGESTSFDVALPMMPKGQGAHRLVAEYENADSVINIVPDNGAGPKSVSGVWTGSARSDELFVNDTP